MKYYNHGIWDIIIMEYYILSQDNDSIGWNFSIVKLLEQKAEGVFPGTFKSHHVALSAYGIISVHISWWYIKLTRKPSSLL